MMVSEYRVAEYQIRSPFYFVIRDAENDTERLLFHIQTGDYFAMLATALGFIEEALARTDVDVIPSAELAVLRHMKKDLIFLNARYRICEKTKIASCGASCGGSHIPDA
jgi:hypothetical protein